MVCFSYTFFKTTLKRKQSFVCGINKGCIPERECFNPDFLRIGKSKYRKVKASHNLMISLAGEMKEVSFALCKTDNIFLGLKWSFMKLWACPWSNLLHYVSPPLVKTYHKHETWTLPEMVDRNCKLKKKKKHCMKTLSWITFRLFKPKCNGNVSSLREVCFFFLS